MDSSLERRVKESSTKQVAQNKNHFPHDIFRKLAFRKRKQNAKNIFEYHMMVIVLMFDLRERKNFKIIAQLSRAHWLILIVNKRTET